MITAMPRIAIAVNDWDQTLSTFRDALGMPIVDISESSLQSLGAHVAMCVPEGGSNIELMSPGRPEAPLSQSLQKFLDRRGQGLFALMLEAPDPDAEAEELLARGLDVLPLMEGAGGRDVHPRSTHGVLIRVYPDNSFTDTTDDTSLTPGLSGISHAIIAVNDVGAAASVYGHGFGLDVSEPELDAERGVMRVVCSPPKGGQIEFVSPADTTRPFAARIASFLGERREGMYALVLRADDPAAAADALEERGIPVERGEDIAASVYGARILIKQA